MSKEHNALLRNKWGDVTGGAVRSNINLVSEVNENEVAGLGRMKGIMLLTQP